MTTERMAGADGRKRITIYTDGACLGNPGPGGYGAVLLYGAHRRELSGGYRLTTNNRMEMLAAIVGLQALREPCHVTLYSDSRYLIDALTRGWAARWRANGWKRTRTEAAVNPDLWDDLLGLAARHQVAWLWVRGHAGNVENERCDALANAAARGVDLPPDGGYERRQPTQSMI
ncbi:MAG: ribonuclease HI [Dehalococcoidia bacterium]